ncbi:hypothetical protein [Microcoleus vaginatus]
MTRSNNLSLFCRLGTAGKKHDLRSKSGFLWVGYFTATAPDG